MFFKKQLWILVFGAVLLFKCQRSTNCFKVKEIKGTNHLVDSSPLLAVPSLLDTLKAHPNLQLYRTLDDEYATGIHCNVFYNGIIVFTSTYSVFKMKQHSKEILTMDKPYVDSIFISPIPTISSTAAIKVAKKTLDYKHTCIKFQIGFYNRNAGISNGFVNYSLVYRIQGDSGFPMVLVDANSGDVLSKDDGKRF